MPNFYTDKSEHADSKPGYDNTWQYATDYTAWQFLDKLWDASASQAQELRGVVIVNLLYLKHNKLAPVLLQNVNMNSRAVYWMVLFSVTLSNYWC